MPADNHHHHLHYKFKVGQNIGLSTINVLLYEHGLSPATLICAESEAVQ
jgi:hypothetical protein